MYIFVFLTAQKAISFPKWLFCRKTCPKIAPAYFIHIKLIIYLSYFRCSMLGSNFVRRRQGKQHHAIVTSALAVAEKVYHLTCANRRISPACMKADKIYQIICMNSIPSLVTPMSSYVHCYLDLPRQYLRAENGSHQQSQHAVLQLFGNPDPRGYLMQGKSLLERGLELAAGCSADLVNWKPWRGT